jgi:hypothetical protein
MMEVTRDVIVDLLPLYLADEASPDTQALVKEYLEQDADLAQLARQWKERLPAPPPAPARPDAQALAFAEAKRWMAIKTLGTSALLTVGLLALAAFIVLMFFLPAP